jgi:hypothetical protein
LINGCPIFEEEKNYALELELEALEGLSKQAQINFLTWYGNQFCKIHLRQGARAPDQD